MNNVPYDLIDIDYSIQVHNWKALKISMDE